MIYQLVFRDNLFLKVSTILQILVEAKELIGPSACSESETNLDARRLFSLNARRAQTLKHDTLALGFTMSEVDVVVTPHHHDLIWAEHAHSVALTLSGEEEVV